MADLAMSITNATSHKWRLG